MSVLLWIVGVLLLGDLILIVYQIVFGIVDPSQLPLATAITPLVVGAGVLVAIITLLINMWRQQSEDYLKNASGLLEKAYIVLAELDAKNRPKNIRINWLAAARFLKACDNICKRITVPSHKAIYVEHKEYWRARFHDLINPDVDGFPEDYFASSPQSFHIWSDDDREPVSENSLAVLYRFVRWPEGFDDPIKNDPGFTDKEIQEMEFFGPKHLGDFMKKVRKQETQRKGDV